MQNNESKAKSLSLELGLSNAATACSIALGRWLDTKGGLSHTPGDIDAYNTQAKLAKNLSRKDFGAFVKVHSELIAFSKAVR